MLLREGLVDKPLLTRCEQVLNKLGDDGTLFRVLVKIGKITEQRMLECIRKHQPDLPIGTLLVEFGLLDKARLTKALELQQQQDFNRKIGEILIAEKMVRERDFTRVLAGQLGFHYEDPDVEKCDPELLGKYTLKTFETFRFLPLRVTDAHTVVAFEDPMNQEARTEVARTLNTALMPMMASASAIDSALAALKRRSEQGANDSQISEQDSISDWVEKIISTAVSEDATDIHIEPLRDRVRIRLRIDGVLREYFQLKHEELSAVVSRIKILAEADISERRRHQEGRIEFTSPSSGKVTDLSVSFFVTVRGECVVMRVLNQNSEILELDDIGMSPAILERFKSQGLESPSGIIIVTGPTGSGKTSTLYSCINHLNCEATSIISAEDPVELQIDGVSQCSVNPKSGRTLGDSLNHVMRQDADVIALGELYDSSSVDSAIQAALTGHKVLTTFHSEDAVGGLLRLLNMDIEAFLISSTVVCVVAQRLIRKVCKECAQPASPDSNDLQLLGWNLEDVAGAELLEGQGCSTCHFSGFHERVAVFETLVLSEQVREAILARKTSAQIRQICIESSGLITLLEDGLLKAASGETTLAEIRRTLPRLSKPRSLQNLLDLSGGRATSQNQEPVR